MVQLPGYPYTGSDPDGFMAKREIQAHLESYAASFGPPVVEGVRANAVRRQDDKGYQVKAGEDTYEARNVVMATGTFQRPKVPEFSTALPDDVSQLHSSEYLDPDQLQPGAVLVVGSGQSGCQIAEELHKSGRTAYLAVGSAGHTPRSYRGKDIFWWLSKMGLFDRTVGSLP